VSLVANYLEANGIPTVIIGSARDIVEHCGVARFVFSDLEAAEGPRTTVRAPFEWKDDPDWRERYNLITPENRARLLAIGDERRAQRGQAARKTGADASD
jgi:D-proline reductase (dithiol) PrdB